MKSGFSRFLGRSAVLALALETAYMGLSLRFQAVRPSFGPPRDALMVYAGGPGRLAAGLGWVKQGCAPVLVYSDMPDAMASWATPALFRRAGVKRVFLVPALTTTDNARHCMALARAQAWRRVILVTAWYHLPRARLVTWIYGWDSPVTIEAVASGAVPGNWYEVPVFWMEWVKLWGSLARIVLGLFTRC